MAKTRNKEIQRLALLRTRIQKLDIAILNLLHARALTAAHIGACKRRLGQPIRQASREKELLNRLLSHSSGSLPPAYVRAIYKLIFRYSRSIQSSDYSST